MFFRWVKGNSICTAPFMDAGATNVHVTLDRFVLLGSFELLEYGEIICKKSGLFCGNTMNHIAEEDVPQRGAKNRALENGIRKLELLRTNTLNNNSSRTRLQVSFQEFKIL